MQQHTKIYLKALKVDRADYLASELSGRPGNDIHHINCRGMGGDPNKTKDRIENLMLLTREEHNHYGDKKKYMFYLYYKHFSFLKLHNVTFDEKWMIDQMEMWKCEAVEFVNN